LNEIYEKEAEELEPWKDSPGEISRDDWRDFLGKREWVCWNDWVGCADGVSRYQRAFIDFFEDQLVSTRYHLEELLDEYLFGGKEPLINGLIAGRTYGSRIRGYYTNSMFVVAHPLIHLGYAYELESKTVAIEALALAACFYNPLHKYIDDPKYTKLHGGGGSATSLHEILDMVREDEGFDNLYTHPSGDINKVFEQHEEALLNYWNAWSITDPTEQFEEAQQIAAAMVAQTNQEGKFSFFFVHVLTSSHAIRILLPLVPAKFHVNLIRQWWLFTLAVYIAQMRPSLEPGGVERYNIKGRTWKHVVHSALEGPHSKDAHYVKSEFFCSLILVRLRADE
jgi:hypothetical protein